jgi:pimeloyl-ACP methyl ester carboxylesterase
MSRKAPHIITALKAAAWGLEGCGLELWRPPPPTPAQLDVGLIVLYPGSTNTITEMKGFHDGLRDAGIGQAIEVVAWAAPLEHFFNPAGFVESNRPWAKAEAARIATFQDQHPEAPVTLIGYSAGAMAAIMAAEELPAGRSVACVLLMSSAVSACHDLESMLEHTDAAIVYLSPADGLTEFATRGIGTVDGAYAFPAATYGFFMGHEKLRQIAWEPWMGGAYGNYGNHVDYLFNVPWIRDFVAPWLAHVP